MTAESRLVVEAAAAADLELALAGVPLPWPVLGGSLGEPVSERVRIEIGAGTLAGLTETGHVLLTDGTSLPLGRLDAVRVQRDGEGGVVSGELTSWSTSDPPPWSRPADAVVLVQRPPLVHEIDRIAASGVVSGDVVILVPVGPSPDGIPFRVMLDAWQRSVAGHPGLRVEPVPVHWRDAGSDGELVKALAGFLTRNGDLELLSSDDETWRRALEQVAAGAVSASVPDAATRALLAWRPAPSARGLVVFFTGFSGSGKSSLATALVEHIDGVSRRTVSLLDGDLVRLILSSGLGFDRAGRDLNIRRIGFVAAEIARHHGIAVCAPIAPFDGTRKAVRAMAEENGDFVLVHVSTPLEECERRDRKGLYARARAGEIPEFTGISSPYEVPTDADLVIDTTGQSLDESLALVLHHLRGHGWIDS